MDKYQEYLKGLNQKVFNGEKNKEKSFAWRANVLQNATADALNKEEVLEHIISFSEEMKSSLSRKESFETMNILAYIVFRFMLKEEEIKERFKYLDFIEKHLIMDISLENEVDFYKKTYNPAQTSTNKVIIFQITEVCTMEETYFNYFIPSLNKVLTGIQEESFNWIFELFKIDFSIEINKSLSKVFTRYKEAHNYTQETIDKIRNKEIDLSAL